MDKGIVPGFFAWLGKAVRGDFGDSWKYTVPVTQKFKEVVGISFIMSFVVMILEIAISVPLGIIAATKQYSWQDNVISIVALAGISLPTFFTASLLKLVFSVKLQWFDLGGKKLRYSLSKRKEDGYCFTPGFTDSYPADCQHRSIYEIYSYQYAGGIKFGLHPYCKSEGTFRGTGNLSSCFPEYLDYAGYHLGYLSSRIIFRSHDYGAALFHSGNRLHLLSGYDFRRHSVLHVLLSVYCRFDLDWKPAYGYFICRGRSSSSY